VAFHRSAVRAATLDHGQAPVEAISTARNNSLSRGDGHLLNSIGADCATCTTLVVADGRLVVRKIRSAHTDGAVEAEARWLSNVRHQGIVALARVVPHKSMIETIFGGTTTLRTARLSPAKRAQVLVEVAGILANCHKRGFVHGNIKPEHVIVPAGTATALLCSPSGLADDTRIDIDGLADLVDHSVSCGVGRSWDQWVSVAEQLRDNRDRVRSSTAKNWLSAMAEHQSVLPRIGRLGRRRTA